METPPTGRISKREAEVLAALGQGLSNAEIASRLYISVRTVESHVSSLLRKLGAADRQTLAALAGPQELDAAVPPGRVSGLPPGRTTFVGRQRDHDAVVGALADGRLVSLVGPGGMGKTRLAAEVGVAVEPLFPAGGVFVDLVPVRAGLVAHAVAAALGVTERPPQALDSTVAGWLGKGRFLLILDNCEHLVEDVAAFAGSILERCPHTTVLATTRQRLGVPGEQVVRLGPLPTEPDGLRLFVDRARAVDGELDLEPSTVASICDRLDGMPLAIEIAAARAASLGLDGLRSVVDDQLRLLGGARGVHPRHTSVGAVIAWSYELLDDEERAVLRELSVFTGRFDLAAAVAVTAAGSEATVADVLGRLVDRSLVVSDVRPGRTRWHLLDTVRVFAAAELAAGEGPAVLRRYQDWAGDSAARIEATLPDDWLPAFEEVADDLRAALSSTAAEPDHAAHRLARSLAHLTFARGFNREARRHYLAAAGRAADAAQACDDIRTAAWVATAVYDGPAAFELLSDAADHARAAGRPDASAAAGASAVIVAVRFPGEFRQEVSRDRRSALLQTATRDADPADRHTAALLAVARACHGPSRSGLGLATTAVDVARQAGDPVLLLGALDVMTNAMNEEARTREANEIVAERLRLVADLPRHDPAAATEITDTFHVAIAGALTAGDLPAAADLVDRASTLDPLAEHPYVTTPRRVRVLTLMGRFGDAMEQADALWSEWQRDGAPIRRWMSTAVALAALAHGLCDDGQQDEWRARALIVAESDQSAGSPILAACMAFVDARLALHSRRFDTARTLVDNAFATFAVRGWEGYARAAGAELAAAAGLPEAAELLTAASPYARDNRWVAACLDRARGRLNGSVADLAAAVAAWTQIEARFERACTTMLLPDRVDEGRAELRALGCASGR